MHAEGVELPAVDASSDSDCETPEAQLERIMLEPLDDEVNLSVDDINGQWSEAAVVLKDLSDDEQAVVAE